MKKKTTNQVLKLKFSTIPVSMYRAAKVVLLLRECRRKQDPKTRPFFSKFKGKAEVWNIWHILLFSNHIIIHIL